MGLKQIAPVKESSSSTGKLQLSALSGTSRVIRHVFTNSIVNAIVVAEYPFQCYVFAQRKYRNQCHVKGKDVNEYIMQELFKTSNWIQLPITDSRGEGYLVGDFKIKERK